MKLNFRWYVNPLLMIVLGLLMVIGAYPLLNFLVIENIFTQELAMDIRNKFWIIASLSWLFGGYIAALNLVTGQYVRSSKATLFVIFAALLTIISLPLLVVFFFGGV